MIPFVGRTVLSLLLAFGIALSPEQLSATVIPVKHKEGTSHGFIVLRSQDKQQLATGEMIQTVDGDRVTSEIVLHFPNKVDAHIDAVSGNVEILSEKDGKERNERQHIQIPEDAANGLILALLKNISPSESETTVSMVTTSSKPRLVKLKIHAEGEQRFSASGHRLNAIHYVVHTDIGGMTGAVANVIGKQPADIHFWIVGGKAPTFVKFTGQLYNGGPVWNIELAAVKWDGSGSASK